MDPPSHESIRDRIGRAAYDEFGRRGYRGARLGEIAANARVSRATLQRQFRSRDELFRALVRSRVQALLARLGSPCLEAVQLDDWFAATVETYLRWRVACGSFGDAVEEEACSRPGVAREWSIGNERLICLTEQSVAATIGGEPDPAFAAGLEAALVRVVSTLPRVDTGTNLITLQCDAMQRLFSGLLRATAAHVG